MIKKALMLLSILLIATIVGVYSYFDIMVKRAIEIYGSDILGVAVSVGDVYTSLKNGTISVGHVHVANPPVFIGGTLFEIDHMRITLDIRSLFSPVVKIYDIQVKRPALIYEFGPRGDNLSVFKKYVHKHEASAPEGSLAKDSTKKKVIILNFRIEDGRATASLAQFATKAVALPAIHMTDIGVARGGILFEQAATEIADEVVRVIKQIKINALLNQFDKLPLGAVETIGTVGVEGAAGAIGEVLKNLF